jgi:hypothetical protein
MNAYPVTKQFPKSLNNGEAKSKPESALARRIVNLVVFFEYFQQLLIRYPDAGVPDLDTQSTAAPTTSKQNLSALSVF